MLPKVDYVLHNLSFFVHTFSFCGFLPISPDEVIGAYRLFGNGQFFCLQKLSQRRNVFMSQISVNALTFNYEGSFDNIFENVSFSLDTSWKLGFIGRNGKGKTTFLDLLMGKYDYKGSISTSARFEYFPYRLSQQQYAQCAGEFLDEIKPGCESWRVMSELAQLGEQADILFRPFAALSPGEQTKVLLAVLFRGKTSFCSSTSRPITLTTMQE
jgi:ATPase subunit of ABC transporter with duplicated ATPase domains